MNNPINTFHYKKTQLYCLAEQFSEIIGVGLGILLVYLFAEFPQKTTYILLLAIPLIIVLLKSKHNKPIVKFEVDQGNGSIEIERALLGSLSKCETIRFEDVKFVHRMRFVLQWYTEVIEIKAKNTTKIVVMKKYKKQFNDLISISEKLRGLGLINNEQIIVKKNVTRPNNM